MGTSYYCSVAASDPRDAGYVESKPQTTLFMQRTCPRHLVFIVTKRKYFLVEDIVSDQTIMLPVGGSSLFQPAPHYLMTDLQPVIDDFLITKGIVL